MKKRFALIVAGGNGKRMGTDISKQFLLLKGLPVLMHTINKFRSCNAEIIVVLPASQKKYWLDLCSEFHFTVPHTLIEGGTERYHSVLNGLNRIEEEGVVAIHDGVRPCVSTSLIEKCYVEAEIFGNAVAAVKPKDSLRMLQGEHTVAVNREHFYLIQTPQTFDLGTIKHAYASTTHENFTDDASVLEANEHDIHLVDGDYKNLKITTPEDLLLAELFI